MIATELWYSAVIRSNWLHGNETARDLSRKVADWRRFSLWSNYDLFTKRLHVVLLGWPPEMRGNFQSVFQTSDDPPCILCEKSTIEDI